jgi:hypothetical protein
MSSHDTNVVSAAGMTRRQRQQVEVLALVVLGAHSRASALGREHLQEFPADELVRLALDWAGLA